MAILSVIFVAARRLWSTRWLALASALGLIVVVALTLSVPIYSDAVYYRILNQNVEAWGEARRPPFAFMYRYVGSPSSPVAWERVLAADQLMQSQLPGLLGMPRPLLVRYFASAAYPVFPTDASGFADQRQSVVRAPLGFISDLSDHITLIDGAFPADTGGEAGPSDVMPVLVSDLLAGKLGLQVGERFVVFDEQSAKRQATRDISQIPIVIAGVWAPRDDAESFWYSHPSEFQNVLLTTESNFQRRLAPQVKEQQYLAVWYSVFDGSGVRVGDVAGLLDRISLSVTRAGAVLPNTRLDYSPVELLKRYQRTSTVLTVQLLAFSIPILGLTFVFIALVAGLTVNGQRNEIAVLRSRGASVAQVLVIALIEAVVLGALVLGASAPAGEQIARLVGQTRSFLDFIGRADVATTLPTAITFDSLRSGIIIVGLAVLITVVPVWGAAQHTVVTYKQERARSMRPPWWQRVWLDALIFIPAAYGTYLLQKQGVVAMPDITAATTPGQPASDPFSNPLLFLVPILAMIALSLFIIRLLPLLLRVLQWVLGWLPGTSMLLAIRQLARSPSFYAAPILLLTLTLALATFTASLAATLDQNLVDRVRYRVGGDMSLTESMEDTGGGAPMGDGGQTTGESDRDRAIRQAAEAERAKQPQRPSSMAFVPVEEHTRVDGVQAAARVGRYPISLRLSGNNLQGDFIGVDRLDYARVSYWRGDFAAAPLGTLMNALAATPDGVLIPDLLMAQYGLRSGDPIIGRVRIGKETAELTLRVVGTFRLWPGWYPKGTKEGLVFVGNLDYLFESAGWQAPYRVWLKVREDRPAAQIAQDLNDMGFSVVRYETVKAQIEQEQARPERQGLFGMLSVGFVAAALLTVLGFFLYSVFSFRRRLIELGVLRAIGFSASQMATFLGWELLLLLGTGIVAGTGLGVLASRVYIPFMQVGASAELSTVPFQIIIAWQEMAGVYALFGVLFVVALAVLLVLMLRMKVFQAVKLGESY